MLHAHRDLAARSADHLDDLSAVTPRDGDEMRLLERERGTAETIRHFAAGGMLTAEGLIEAHKILAAGADWVRELETDRDLPRRPKL